jgi:hypothetical protein
MKKGDHAAIARLFGVGCLFSSLGCFLTLCVYVAIPVLLMLAVKKIFF